MDDLLLQVLFLYRWLAGAGEVRWPSEAELDRAPARPIAVFVPLWHEDRVIQRMLEHNLAANRYPHCEFFIGVYPNDEPTRAAVGGVCSRFPQVHTAVCPRPGPTSKADCLNAIYRRMQRYEQEHARRYEVVVIHDAEDLIHPEALRLINYFSGSFDMIQVPVLALPTPSWEWTHAMYCDEFAEYQSKDIPVRQMLGGFVASCGVGTGFSRAVLERLAERDGLVFDPSCLAEDYHIGFRIHQLRCPQLFVGLRRREGRMVATREYFPRTLKAAVKQRTRWVMGISLQSWEKHGWRAGLRQVYWLWRDRKGLVGNLLTPVVNLMFLQGAATWLASVAAGTPWYPPYADPHIPGFFAVTLAFSTVQMAVRMGCVARIYGWRFAAGVPLRAPWGNLVNFAATAMALWRYFRARLRNHPLVWLKTDHMYPAETALVPYGRGLRPQELRTMAHDAPR